MLVSMKNGKELSFKFKMYLFMVVLYLIEVVNVIVIGFIVVSFGACGIYFLI